MFELIVILFFCLLIFWIVFNVFCQCFRYFLFLMFWRPKKPIWFRSNFCFNVDLNCFLIFFVVFKRSCLHFNVFVIFYCFYFLDTFCCFLMFCIAVLFSTPFFCLYCFGLVLLFLMVWSCVFLFCDVCVCFNSLLLFSNVCVVFRFGLFLMIFYFLSLFVVFS